MIHQLHGRYLVMDLEPTSKSIDSFSAETELANHYVMRAMPHNVAVAAKKMAWTFLNSDLMELSAALEVEKIRRVTERLTT